MRSNKILVTGVAGFVGYHLTKKLFDEEFNVVGIDNLNNYYDVNLKLERLKILQNYKITGLQSPPQKTCPEMFLHGNGGQAAQHVNNGFFRFERMDLNEREKLFELFENEKFDYVIHLAAQAGVRYSIENPYAYIDSNIYGFMNILEACRKFPIKHLIYASSSSVYGSNKKVPFSESDNVDHPISLYAATKKSNELMAHTYSSLYNIPTTGLRFFTVYGPWGRPDMAYYSFTKNILEGKPINVFNQGDLQRDFTYIDDIIEGIVKLLDKSPIENSDWDRENSDPSTSFAPYNIFNIGNNQPVNLMDFIRILEELLNKKAEINFMPMQDGDVYITYADISRLSKFIGFTPSTKIKEGLAKFVEWYKKYTV